MSICKKLNAVVQPTFHHPGRQAVLSPGGSSAGSAATVAANLVTVAIGSETNGSINPSETAVVAMGLQNYLNKEGSAGGSVPCVEP